MFRYLAPAGAPIGHRELRAWIGRVAVGGDAIDTLERTAEATLGVRRAVAVSSGRAAFTVLLAALKRLAQERPDHRVRDEVIVPCYTCYSVAASIVRAGLVPRPIDIDPATLDYDHDRLRAADFRRVLAVVATNLYGMPSDLATLTATARQRGAFVIDDAAQALGARVGGRGCGTRGDVGLISFDKGKNISAIDGGAILTDQEPLAHALAEEAAALPAATLGASVDGVIKLAVYAALLRPSLYWLPNSTPGLGLGRTVYTTRFAITRPPAPLAALATVTLGRLADYTEARRANAAALLAALDGLAGVQAIRPLPGAEPAYLRLPLLLESREQRDRAIAGLNRAGIGASGSYPTSIADIPELRSALGHGAAAGARSVADRIITLPTHPMVEPRDVATMARVMAETLSSPRAMNGRACRGRPRVVAR
jgi:perosamine synthetase